MIVGVMVIVRKGRDVIIVDVLMDIMERDVKVSSL